MRNRIARSGWLLAALAVLAAVTALFQALAAETSARVPVETLELDNGMKLLLVRRPELASVMLGWVAHVGSSNERPGMTGITHLFEHMMFKGTHTIGTKDIERDLQIIAEQERIQERIRAIYDEQRLRWRRGEISDPFDPANRTAELGTSFCTGSRIGSVKSTAISSSMLFPINFNPSAIATLSAATVTGSIG